MNEPRYIWRAINSKTDIWYTHRDHSGGELSLDESDAVGQQATQARRMFRFRLWITRRRQLLEKLPINSFRIAYLRALFPKCRFVHLIRHGLEVAYSIARTGSRWYEPNNGHKWGILAQFARGRGLEQAFLDSCRNDLEKGLIEWTLSVETALETLAAIPAADQLEIRYEQLMDHPSETIGRVEDFLELARDESMHDDARRTFQRRSLPAASLSMPESMCVRSHQLLKRLDFH